MLLECFIVLSRQSTRIDGKPRSTWFKAGVFASEADAKACYESIPIVGGQTAKLSIHWTAASGVEGICRTHDSSFRTDVGSPEYEEENESLFNVLSNAVLDFCLAVDRDRYTSEMDASAKQTGG